MDTNKLLQTIKDRFSFRPNRNQLQELDRLVFEISRREKLSPEKIIADLPENIRFSRLKNLLIGRRFPLATKQEKISTHGLFLNELPKPLVDNWQPKREFKPLKILVEKEAKQSQLLKNFQNHCSGVEIEEIKLYSDYLKKHKFALNELKKPYIFIVKERWDFLKPCPCTKYHLGCGYWILNLGFGCPYDCSYCFLQHYTNSPGIVLPANLEDFFEQFDKFSQKIKLPIRIGTGEFCDSLALDQITGYSKMLIPYFQNKNVLFELKTKSTNIKNLLDLRASKNIIISWSLSPEKLAGSEELAAPGLNQRLQAAQKIQAAGYSIGFHFDPIIYSPTWENDYQDLLKSLYQQLKPPLAWISLGTLRSNRRLKTVCEQRFPESNIFYGELLTGEDGKLRYPEFLRQEIYQKMAGWIRQYDSKTPVYLCMENKSLWKTLGEFDSSKKIEKYILSP
ncbi:MAG: spore photoproduct lyase family protein [Candidatus Omnitrophota bacterium]